LPAGRITFLKCKENSIFVNAKKIAAGLTTESVTCLDDNGLLIERDLKVTPLGDQINFHSSRYADRLMVHPNQLANILANPISLRRLKRVHPTYPEDSIKYYTLSN